MTSIAIQEFEAGNRDLVETVESDNYAHMILDYVGRKTVGEKSPRYYVSRGDLRDYIISLEGDISESRFDQALNLTLQYDSMGYSPLLEEAQDGKGYTLTDEGIEVFDLIEPTFSMGPGEAYTKIMGSIERLEEKVEEGELSITIELMNEEIRNSGELPD